MDKRKLQVIEGGKRNYGVPRRPARPVDTRAACAAIVFCSAVVAILAVLIMTAHP